MTCKAAVFGGSFDPVTNGHLRVISDALNLFDKVIVVIAINPNKTGLFTAADRLQILNEAFAEAGLDQSRVEAGVLPKSMATVAYAKSIGASHLIRGIRSATDLEYEFQLNLVNSKVCPDIHTAYFLTPREHIEVSSSMVKGLIGIDGWESIAKQYVPASTMKWLISKDKTK
jgi:pantetheine-phosphate adenylyltransferase